jgi:hypothetical protein
MLQKALPDMFHYLDDHDIPRSTNGLEGYFSRLKRYYRQHRGLTPKKRENYFAWYVVVQRKCQCLLFSDFVSRLLLPGRKCPRRRPSQVDLTDHLVF